MITVKVTKSLVTDDNKTFNEGQEISFNYFCKHYICTIEKICRKKGYIKATDVECEGNKLLPKTFYLSDMKDVDYVYYD